MVSPTNIPLSMPTPLMPIGDIVDGGDSPVCMPSVQWWQFFQGLFKRSAATIPYLVATGLTAAGTLQADALELTAEWNAITTTAANTGALLFNFGEGFDSRVWNLGANALKVYPPLGCEIDALGANSPYSLAAGKVQVFSQLSATAFRSLQPLG